ncbi:hypothetical protein PYCC9005_003507 [Savitreella phatthalungensis]
MTELPSLYQLRLEPLPLTLRRDPRVVQLHAHLKAALEQKNSGIDETTDELRAVAGRLARLQIIQAELEYTLAVGNQADESGRQETGLLHTDIATLLRPKTPTNVNDRQRAREQFLRSMQKQVLHDLYPEKFAAVHRLFSDEEHDPRDSTAAAALKKEILRDMVETRLQECLREWHMAEGAVSKELCTDLVSEVDALERERQDIMEYRLPEALLDAHDALDASLHAHIDYSERMRHDLGERWTNARLGFAAAGAKALHIRVATANTELGKALYTPERTVRLASDMDTVRGEQSAVDDHLDILRRQIEQIEAKRTPAYLRALAEYDALEQDCADAQADIERLRNFRKTGNTD